MLHGTIVQPKANDEKGGRENEEVLRRDRANGRNGRKIFYKEIEPRQKASKTRTSSTLWMRYSYKY